MGTDNDILELKFEGNGIKPEIVKPSEIALLIDQFEKVLLATIHENSPEINTTDAVLFSFEAIKDESLDIQFKSILAKDIILASFTLISTSINTGDFSKLPPIAITSLKNITKFSKKYNCTGQFNHNNQTLSTFNPTTEISLDKVKYIKGETTIHGTLIDIGGENPNIHIKVNDDYTLIFDSTVEISKALSPKLYERVGLKGTAKWDALTFHVIDFKLAEVLDYEQGSISNAFAELRNISSGIWDKYNTNDEINNQLLRD